MNFNNFLKSLFGDKSNRDMTNYVQRQKNFNSMFKTPQKSKSNK